MGICSTVTSTARFGVSAWFWLWQRSFFATYSQYLAFFFNDFGNYAQLICSEAKLLAIFSEIFLLLSVRMVLVFWLFSTKGKQIFISTGVQLLFRHIMSIDPKGKLRKILLVFFFIYRKQYDQEYLYIYILTKEERNMSSGTLVYILSKAGTIVPIANVYFCLKPDWLSICSWLYICF